MDDYLNGTSPSHANGVVQNNTKYIAMLYIIKL